MCVYGNQKKKANRKLTFTRVPESMFAKLFLNNTRRILQLKYGLKTTVYLNFHTARERQNARPINNNS